MSSEAGPRAQPYPRFSDAEMLARRRSLEALVDESDLDHLVVYGANRSGSAVGWLTRWPVSREALVVFTPGIRDVLLVNFYNHVPNAQRLATEADVRWASSTMEAALEELDRRGGRRKRVGVIGPLGYKAQSRLFDFASTVADLNAAYEGLRLIKSEEEIEWLRIGVAMTDAGMQSLHLEGRPGLSEYELGDLVERAYTGDGGGTHIHYLAATPMDAPQVCVPAQWPSARRLRRGDVLLCEISASFWDYPGQLLRTLAVEAEPAPRLRELHDVADAAFDAILARLRPGATAAEIVDAASVIEDSGFTTRDDLVHGFVGGYLPPILGSKSRALEPTPDFVFRAGMTVVVQPNVVTPDEHAGVQTGELVLITEAGAERLHDYERGFLRVR
jgi:Xaa-Pro aminopeptidase